MVVSNGSEGSRSSQSTQDKSLESLQVTRIVIYAVSVLHTRSIAWCPLMIDAATVCDSCHAHAVRAAHLRSMLRVGRASNSLLSIGWQHHPN